MNTCAECRFWKSHTPDVIRSGGGVWNECEKVEAMIVVICAGGFNVLTRSDFGCVQFEKRAVDLTGIPSVRDGVHHWTVNGWKHESEL